MSTYNGGLKGGSDTTHHKTKIHRTNRLARRERRFKEDLLSGLLSVAIRFCGICECCQVLGQDGGTHEMHNIVHLVVFAHCAGRLGSVWLLLQFPERFFFIPTERRTASRSRVQPEW